VIKEGRDVDHIQPIRLGGEVYDLDNLQTLCKSCHNRKSGKEAHIKE
jgi:HNH endonuclease.